jgi:hypothetical protein
MISLPRFSFALIVAFAVMAASNASAQTPAPKVAPSSESPALPPPSVTPAPPSLPPVSPQESVTVPGGYTCDVSEYAAVDPDDARTTADLVCNALAAHHARPGSYNVRIGKLGTKLLLVVTERATGEERSLFLDEIEEVRVAAGRLAVALAQNKPVEQTQNADNAVPSEVPQPEQRRVKVGAFVGVTSMEGVGLVTSPSAGAEGDLVFQLQRLSLLLEARAGGIGSANNLLGYGVLGTGARYYTSDDDTAAFVGGGVSFAYYQANRFLDTSYSGSGFSLYGEVGVAFLRSSAVGVLISLRSDLPLFTLDQTEYNDAGALSTTSQYVVPISLTLGLRIH